MRKVFLSVLFSFLTVTLFSQNFLNEKPKDSEYYLNVLKGAKDSLYNYVIEKYDSYLAKNPRDISICIEKCKLLDNAYYDAVEEYNPKYAEHEHYLDSLIKVFPDEPELFLYRMDFKYGDSAIAFCKKILQHREEHSEKWKGINIWKVYSNLSSSYGNNDNPTMSIHYGLLAVENNDTLDLSLSLAQNYQDLNKDKEAISVLIKSLDSTSSSWELGRKGKLLLDLGAVDKALQVLKWARKDTTMDYNSNSTLAEIMIEKGLYSEARVYLLKDMESSWNKSQDLVKLFEHDLKYSSGDSAAVSYKRMSDDAFMNDPFGIKRIRLFFKSPTQFWTIKDFSRLGLLLLAIVAVFLIPYLWILPIHYLGNHFIKKGKIFSNSSFRWSLRHFWLISSLILLADLFANLIFSHDSFFGIMEVENQKPVNLNLANMSVFIFTVYAITAFCFLRRHDLKNFFGTFWSKSKSILIGIGFALVLKVGTAIYLLFYKVIEFNLNKTDTALTIVDNIVSVNQFYHPMLSFLFVVILGPIYEEIIFRGIILSATEKYMRFFWANFLQASLFAVIHIDWKLLPFYFAFGLLAGYQRKNSQALASGISMHMTNNLMAFFATLAIKA